MDNGVRNAFRPELPDIPVFPVIELGAVMTSGPKVACTAHEKMNQASDSKLNGEIRLGSCAESQSIVIFPMVEASETAFLSKRSEYFSAIGLISSK
jgi:hypothetical protein